MHTSPNENHNLKPTQLVSKRPLIADLPLGSANGFLFKISKPESNNIIYILGSVHKMDGLKYEHFGSHIQTVFDKADAVFFEIAPPENSDNLNERKSFSSHGVDSVLHSKAIEAQKFFDGIERGDRQREELFIKLQTLDLTSGKKLPDTINDDLTVQEWFTGRPMGGFKSRDEIKSTLGDALFQDLCTTREKEFYDAIDELFLEYPSEQAEDAPADPYTAMFVIGAAHIVDQHNQPAGLLQLLEESEYNIERVLLPTADLSSRQVSTFS